MDAQTLITAYLASSHRIGIRPWHRRRDRRQINHWPPYFPALPSHWLAAPPVTSGERVSYAIDLLAASGDRLIGRVSLLIADSAARLGIVLHPDQIGAGFGSEAMRLMLTVGHQLGLATIRLDVAATNCRAFRCYARAGFVAVGETWRDGYCYRQMERAYEPEYTSSTDAPIGADSHADAGGVL